MMMQPIRLLDQHLAQRGSAEIFLLAACSVLLVGGLDYLTGYEVAMSLFYLGPVAVAAWYGRRWTGIAIAILSSISWSLADIAAGNVYSHPAIPVWNTLVRLGIFLIMGVLLNAFRENLRIQQYLAQTDVLTGLYGRRAFEESLKHDLALGRRRKSALTIAYMDLDDFKIVNDTLGHAGGDRLLKLIGVVLQTSVRETDTPARVGGDEFALLLPDTDDRGAQMMIARLRGKLHEALAAGDCRATCSIGVVTFLESATTPEQALAAADELMYQVKHKGKNAVAFNVVG